MAGDKRELTKRVNRCKDLKELARVIKSFADPNGMIQAKGRKIKASKMAKACRNLADDHMNIFGITANYGIRKKAITLVKNFSTVAFELR